MNIREKIVEYGATHIWQNPLRDRNTILQLSKISPRNGYTNYGRVHRECIACPTVKGYYHFYQIGGNTPNRFALFSYKEKWFKLSDWCNENELVIHLYDKHGRCFPISEAYMYRMKNDNIIIGVSANKNKTLDFNDSPLYIHFYHNYFYQTDLKDDSADQIVYKGNIHSPQTSNQDVLTRYQVNKLKQKGKQHLIQNGYLVDVVDPSQFKNDDTLECFYDYSIRKVVDIPVSSLRTYHSTLDQKTKYLIHPPKDDINIIDYRDDIDIFIYQKKADSQNIKGVYYHRNMEDSVRMVTHRDYGLPVPYVMSHIQHLDPHYVLDEFYIRLYIRRNGPEKALISDVNKLKSLYFLSDEEIVNALTMVNSTLPEWTADYLERSAYPAVMRSYREELTPALVLDAMGYTSTAKAFANPNHIIKLSKQGNHFALPEGLMNVCTIYEYNANGHLLGWYHHRNGAKHYPYNEGCVYIEALAGIGSEEISIHTTNTPFSIEYNTAYRFYLTETESGEIIHPWRDNTSDPRIQVDKENMLVTYGFKNVGEAGVIIGDDKFLAYELDLDLRDGLMDFSLRYGQNNSFVLPIPPGKIDLWLNGHALVEDIDYFVDFPNIVVVSKTYIDDEKSKQTITVRCTGFPFTEEGVLKRIKPRETGFIQYGKVSVNEHFDLHDDRLLRCVVDGGVFDPSVITFDEEGSAEVSRFADDGKPYSIETPYISLQSTLGVDIYEQQVKDHELSLRISDYLTKFLPKERYVKPPVIVDLYPLYSPFISAIALDLKYNRLKSPPVRTKALEIDKIIEKYKKYLPMDPAVRGFDPKFCGVHAHAFKEYIELTARDLAFLEKVNDIYLKSQIDISRFFRVKTGKKA